jgi:hypothetical protein
MITYFVNYSFLAESGTVEVDTLDKALAERTRLESMDYVVVIQAVDSFGSIVNEM